LPATDKISVKQQDLRNLEETASLLNIDGIIYSPELSIYLKKRLF
jgi:hypothetical protein